ncbi:hypothetical protein BJ165DRAFT_1403749 [Panaeolus papilionaceus]|nr:hypothetical protein BJ165DRAFT_1403749 [Panaeolus papilionaceus]
MIELQQTHTTPAIEWVNGQLFNFDKVESRGGPRSLTPYPIDPRKMAAIEKLLRVVFVSPPLIEAVSYHYTQSTLDSQAQNPDSVIVPIIVIPFIIIITIDIIIFKPQNPQWEIIQEWQQAFLYSMDQ